MALPIGHTLVGLTIARKTNISFLQTLILASVADIDYFFGLFVNGNMLTYHRSSLTHSPFFAVFVALLFWLWGKLRGKAYPRSYIVGIFLIVASHWFVDNFMPFLYKFDFNAGRNGLFDFLFAHIISFEFLYNNLVDLVFYGVIYVLVMRFVLREKKLF